MPTTRETILSALQARLSAGRGIPRELQALAAEELALLPDGSAIVEMMGDYAVVREQARACTST